MTRISPRATLLAAFVLSGFSGLIYESLWTHYLRLFLGHAAFAQSLVLAIFMGGMALGGWTVSVWGVRQRNLLAAYAATEAGIGLYALAFPPLFDGSVEWAYASAFPALGGPAAVECLQWGIAIVLLLPPSVALGATFPLMGGAVLRRFPGADGRHLASLYFANSLGAAAGALAASFLLIGTLGLPGTLALAGTINLAVAAVAGRVARTPEPPARAAAPPRAAGAAAGDATLLRLFVAAAAVTGAASFVYEVTWVRMLSLVLSSSFHAFELMLSAFITGLALGSLAIRRRIDRIGQPLAWAAWIQIAMGVLAAATLPVYAESFDWMAGLVKALPRDGRGWMLFNLASHGIAFAVMLPATFLAGMTLPLFTHVLLRAGHGERSIGRVYAANSVGAIAGVLLAVHVGLPQAGIKLTLAAGALLDVVLGVLLLRAAAGDGRRPRFALAAAFGALALPLWVARAVHLDPAMLGSGVYRSGEAHPKLTRTLFHRDGKTATISVSQYGDSLVSIKTNGKPDAAIELDRRRPPARDEVTMVLAGALPLVLRPEARQVANIGFGSGLTTHVLLAGAGVAEVSTIEIERAVVEGARIFGTRVARAYEDPRSRVYIEDAKSWFARQQRRFDIIVSEPSNPWVSGVASLFSEEFYRRIKENLAPGGLLVQWLQVYESDLRLLASIVKALDGQFDDYVVYDIDGSNVMFIASARGPVQAPDERVLARSPLREELERVHVRTGADLHFRWLGSKKDLGAFLRRVDAPANADAYPYVELRAPRSRFLGTGAGELGVVATSQLPVLEMLAPPGVHWTARALSGTSIGEAQQGVATPRLGFVAVAKEFAATLLGRPSAVERIRTDVRGHVDALRGCAELATPQGLAALHDLALNTLAFLDVAALAPLWAPATWLPCPPAQWPAPASRRLALYRAVAQRDAQAMAEIAGAALAADADAADAAPWRRFALAAALLGRRARGEVDAVGRLWQRHGAALYEGPPPADVALLLAVPAARDPAMPQARVPLR